MPVFQAFSDFRDPLRQSEKESWRTERDSHRIQTPSRVSKKMPFSDRFRAKVDLPAATFAAAKRTPDARGVYIASASDLPPIWLSGSWLSDAALGYQIGR